MFTPRLKSLSCFVEGETIFVSVDPRTRIELDDPTGVVLALLQLLREGSRTAPQLRQELAEQWPEVSGDDVDEALAKLDELGLLENAGALRRLSDYQRDRYFSNLAFFDAFTRLDRSREEIQHALLRSSVLLLGAGGLGSSVLQHLAGLGVGAVTIVDFDKVELRNFARQFTYSEGDIGRSKVERVAHWAREFNSTMVVRFAEQRIESADDVRDLLGDAQLVVSAIDQPPLVDLMVNEACVPAGVPFIRGGLAYVQGLYWSVDPGQSACRQCLESYRDAHPDTQLFRRPRLMERDLPNRAIGPVAGMLGSLVAMEAMRYLTKLTPPVSAGTYQLVDFSRDCGISSDPWPADPNCGVCVCAPQHTREALTT